jgi:hypothetical protein
LSSYIFRTTDILESYKKILRDTQTKSFVVKNEHINTDKLIQKNRLLFDYLLIAQEFVDIENFKLKPEIICECCKNSNFDPTENETIYICSNCGIQIDIVDDSPSFKDTDRINMASRYTYTTRGHFIDAMNRFEGKENTTIDDSVIKKLGEAMLQCNLTKETVKKDHIYMFMNELKLGDYYENLNFIYFKLTGTNPPDITAERAELLEMNDEIDMVYDYKKDPDRVNAQNVNFKLYKLLQLLNYPFSRDDFFFLKTPTKEREHHEKWREQIEELQKKYPNATTSKGEKRWRYIPSF